MKCIKLMKDHDHKEVPKDNPEEQLAECQKLCDEYLNNWKRSHADFLNYKKDEMKRTEELMRYVNIEIVMKLLPILDNFDLALKQDFGKEKASEKIIEGFVNIKKQIQDLLKSYEVEEIKAIGEKFDPQFHEVIEEVENKDKEQGIIVEEIQKGYMFAGQVLRPAKVKISK